VGGVGALPFAAAFETVLAPTAGGDTARFDTWRSGVQRAVESNVDDFVRTRCAANLGDARVDPAHDVLAQFVTGGKCLRSTFVYIGWLCGAEASDSALRAAASFELLHAFALLQDDVMDGSALRRGRPAAHIQFARWHRNRRTELAVGQFADLVNDARGVPALDAVLDVARRKSGNYTVRRPLEIGAAMAGCDGRTLALLGRYGAAVGEAFQLRDDLLGIFGSASATGKPSGGDLSEHKATSVVVAAHHMADATIRRQLTELMNTDHLDDAALARWRTLIVATGAVQWIEEMIADRVASARDEIHDTLINEPVRAALVNMAAICTVRAA
jgi:geranylgeranyl diphosphate synthase, type I